METVSGNFDSGRIMVICRRLPTEYLIDTAEAVFRGGIRVMEVTFDTSGQYGESFTLSQIGMLKEHFGSRMDIGAGTVLSARQVKDACSAGASFIVSPDTNLSVIDETKKLGLVSVPGALTPTEIQAAHSAGADYVKVFPANVMGADYFRALCAPLAHIKLLAVGNMDLKTIPVFRAAGAYGFAVGASLIDRRLTDAGKFDELSALAAAMTEAAKG